MCVNVGVYVGVHVTVRETVWVVGRAMRYVLCTCTCMTPNTTPNTTNNTKHHTQYHIPQNAFYDFLDDLDNIAGNYSGVLDPVTLRLLGGGDFEDGMCGWVCIGIDMVAPWCVVCIPPCVCVEGCHA